MEPTLIQAGHSGSWIQADDLRDAALNALQQSGDITLDLQTIDHLDASALQILLALHTEQKKNGRRLHLDNVSDELRRWIDYSGGTEYLFDDGDNQS